MESVVYAVDWNQAREHVLSGAAWLGGPGTGGSEVLEQLRRPTAMICSTKGTAQVTVAGQRQSRDESLLNLIRETISRGGKVLIPSDSSARLLELAYLLEDTWAIEMRKPERERSIGNARVFLASRTSGATMRYVRSMLEWMEEGIVKEFEVATGVQEERHRGGQHGRRGDDDKTASAPFDFRYVNLVEKKSKVRRILEMQNSQVILASDASLEWGYSKEVLQSLASDERNLIILTERMGTKSNGEKGLGRLLWDLWKERGGQGAAVVSGDDSEQAMRLVRVAALEGNEVPLYQQYLATQREKHSTAQGDGTALETSADIVDDRSSSTSSTSEDSEIEMQGKALNTATTLQHARHKLGLSDAELGINILIRRKNHYDYQVQGKKGREKIFPYVAKRRRADDFGDIIRPEDYIRADEEDQIAGEALRNTNSKKENAVGQKRRWDDAIRHGDGGGKRRKPEGQNANGRGDDEASESEAEEEETIEGPTKAIVSTQVLRLRCRIAYVDFSGLHDRRTIQMLVPMIKPRKLIFIAGEADETLSLAEDCRKALNAGSSTVVDVFAPTVGMVIDASVDTNAWSVKLSKEMVKKLHWQKVRGLGVVAITGRLEAASLEPSGKEDEDGGAAKKAKLDAATPATAATEEKKPDTTPILDVVPANISTAVRAVAQPFHVGDLRLADLRRIMQSSGMTAEFRGEGTLVINGTVAVRKSANGKIEVDGGAYSFADPKNTESGTFFKVKRKIYEGLAVVSGG